MKTIDKVVYVGEAVFDISKLIATVIIEVTRETIKDLTK